MQAKKAILVFVAVGAVVLLTGLLFYVGGQEGSLVHRALNPPVTATSSLPRSIANPVTADRTGNNYQLVSTTNLPYADQYLDFLQNSPILEKEFQVVLSHDIQDAQNQYLMGETVISGFKVDVFDKTVTIAIYISPEITDPTKIQYEINSNYLVGVLVASEYQKLLFDPDYQTQYDEARTLVHSIMVQAYDFDEYPFTVVGL